MVHTKGGPNANAGWIRERATADLRPSWAGAPLADPPPTARELVIENERLRFLVETLDGERLVLEARLRTLREMLRARCDEAESLRRRLEETSARGASVP